jgi:hypothetical protein
MSELSREDYESIERAGRELHARGWRKQFSLNEMPEAYETLVSHVEEGYEEMVEEYANDLSCRDWLALAWPMLSPRVQQIRIAELDALDYRFRAATVDDGGRVISRYFRIENKSGWWWHRRPLRTAGAFAADLEKPD